MSIKRRRTKQILETRRNKRVFSGALFLFGIVVFLFIVSVVAIRSDYFSVRDVKVSGEQEKLHNEILSLIEKEIGEKYLEIIPKNSYLVFPKTKIKASVYDSFKEIKRVDVNFDGFNSVNFVVKSRKPFAIWCSYEEDCYFLDEGGFIYSKAPNFSGNAFLKYYGKVDGKIIGSNFLDKEEFNKISFFLKSIKEELSLNPISFEYKDNEYHIYLDKGLNSNGFRGGKIMFNKSDDLGDIFAKLKEIVSDKIITEDVLDKEVELDYIDLRFGNKVYYKFK